MCVLDATRARRHGGQGFVARVVSALRNLPISYRMRDALRCHSACEREPSRVGRRSAQPTQPTDPGRVGVAK